MFSAVRIGRGELNFGAIAEGLVYYGRVNLFVNGGSLSELVRKFGYDALIATMDLGVLDLTFERHADVVHTNTRGTLELHNFANAALGGTAQGAKIESAEDEIEHQFIRLFGKSAESKSRARSLSYRVHVPIAGVNLLAPSASYSLDIGGSLHVKGNTVSTGINFAGNGTVGAPGYGFLSDATGIYHPATWTMGFVTQGTERMRIDSTGNVGIGTTSPDMLLAVGSATPVCNVAHFENSTGSCYINPTTGLSCSSDSRLKANINALSDSSGIAALMQLNPVTYNWTAEATGTPTHSGFIAQQVQPILPDLVSQGPDGYYTLNYAGFTPYLVKAVQEIASITGVFKDNLVAWLGDASNGITRFFADTITANKQLCVKNSDGTPVCVTGDQLTSMLASTGQSPSNPVQISGGSFTIATSSPSSNEGTTTSTTTATADNTATSTTTSDASSTPPTSPPTDATTSAATSTTQ